MTQDKKNNQSATEHKQAGEVLRKSDRKLRAALDATPFPIAVVDVEDNNILYWSHSALELFGHTAPTAPEWYEIAYPDPDYRREVIDRWKPFLKIAADKPGQPVNAGEYQVTCKDGSVRICELYATFLPDTLIVTFNDITERNQAEQELRQYERIVSTSKDMMALMDERYRFIAANKAYQETFQLTKRKLVGKTAAEVLGEDFFNSNIKPHADRCLSGEVVNFQNWTDLPAYGLRYIDISYSPYYDADNKISGYVVNGRDITERKQAEDDLKESHDRFKMIFDAAPT